MNGFDNDRYIQLQSARIDEVISNFGNKLYLEFGGKILDDLHASRVLPGFDPGSKIKTLIELKDKLEIIFCISALDIEKKKIRADYGISYEAELLRLIEHFAALELPTAAVVITRYDDQPDALKFKNRLERRGITTHCHTLTKGYPTDIDTICSDEGYGAQSYIETSKPLIVVAAPGPNSGKLATCLSQLYHEHQRGIRAGFAKFELFPVWNLPLKHPVNMAYEASVADIGDINMIDNFHLEYHGEPAVSYSRDLAQFPILKNILHRILGSDLYHSPTDMGINMAGACITNDEIVQRASKNEIIRRYLVSLCDYKNGYQDISVSSRLKVLMDELDISVDDRAVVAAALEAKEEKKSNTVAIELASGKIVTGKDTDVLTASSSAVINALKHLAGIDDAIHLISPDNLNPMLKVKYEIYGEARLSLRDVLIALAMGETTSSTVRRAMTHLAELHGLEAHSSVMLPPAEAYSLKKLGLLITSTAEFTS